MSVKAMPEDHPKAAEDASKESSGTKPKEVQVQRENQGQGGEAEAEDLSKFPPIKAKWTANAPQWLQGFSKPQVGDSAARLKPQPGPMRDSPRPGAMPSPQGEQQKASLAQGNNAATQGQPRQPSAADQSQTGKPQGNFGRPTEAAAPQPLTAPSEQRRRASPQQLPVSQPPMLSYPPRSALPSLPQRVSQPGGRPTPEVLQRAMSHLNIPPNQQPPRNQQSLRAQHPFSSDRRLHSQQDVRHLAGPSPSVYRFPGIGAWHVPTKPDSKLPGGSAQQHHHLQQKQQPQKQPQQQQANLSRQPLPQQGSQHQKQFSRSGQKLLMLVRSGELKLPLTVRKPTCIGNSNQAGASQGFSKSNKRKLEGFRPFQGSPSTKPKVPANQTVARQPSGEPTGPKKEAPMPSSQGPTAPTPGSSHAIPMYPHQNFPPEMGPAAQNILQAIANGAPLPKTSWQPPSIITGNPSRGGPGFKPQSTGPPQNKPSLVRSGTTSFRHEPAPARQVSGSTPAQPPKGKEGYPSQIPQPWPQLPHSQSQPLHLSSSTSQPLHAANLKPQPMPTFTGNKTTVRVATGPAAPPLPQALQPPAPVQSKAGPPSAKPTAQSPQAPQAPASPGQSKDVPRTPYPKRKAVICNGNKGIYIVDRQVICCLCEQCSTEAKSRGLLELELSPTDFERHSGSCSSKKWKSTVKILEEDAYGTFPGMNVGAWLEKNVPDISRPRGKTHTYSQVFGDVAPNSGPAMKRLPSQGRGKRGTPENGDTGSPADGSATPEPADGDRELLQQGTGARDMSEDRKGSGLKPQTSVAGVTAAGLTDPSGKKWLTSAEDRKQVQLPPAVMREGTDFQARIPLHLPRRPSGREQDHPRAGLPGPSTLEALAIAAGFEKDSSDSLHIDAVADPEYHPGQVYDVRNLMVERGQRSRRKPRWLNQSTDLKNVRAPSEQKSEEEIVVEELPPLTWGPRPLKRKRQQLGDMKRRVRTVGINDVTRGKLTSRDSLLGPEITQWQLLNDGYLRATVMHGSQTYTGVLMPSLNHLVREERGFTNERSLTDGREFNFDRAARLSIANSNSESEPYTGSRGGADSKPSSEWNNMHDYARGTSEGPDIDSYSRGNKKDRSPKKPGTISNRRLIANQDYQRLRSDGPPLGARCALCHAQADPEAKGVFRTEDAHGEVDFDVLDRHDEGLGPFLLVRASAIMNAWVHMQCALWSPEVYVTNEGSVERASDATRRGRMIKCKMCGEKGATLGCHKRSCRASFHLSCARNHGCLLQGSGDESYLVTCPEHSRIQNELDLVPQMPVMPDQRISPDVPLPRSQSTRTDRANSASGNGRTLARQTGWNTLPKMTSSLDTLTAAALASSSNQYNISAPVNPLAASHFGGTVGQSNLRPAIGKEIPSAPPGWRTRRPVANWPAAPKSRGRNSSMSPEDQDRPVQEETSSLPAGEERNSPSLGDMTDDENNTENQSKQADRQHAKQDKANE